MDAYQLGSIANIAVTIASIVLPALASYFIKKITDDSRRQKVIKATYAAFKVVAGLQEALDIKGGDALAAILGRVSDELGGMSAKDEKLAKNVIDTMQLDPAHPTISLLPSPSIQLRGASAVVKK